jgi:hypothetical protein
MAAQTMPEIYFKNTVKPVYNDHPWDWKKVVVVQRWLLFRGSGDEINKILIKNKCQEKF